MADRSSILNPVATRIAPLVPRGDALDEEIRDGLTGSLAEQTSIALQLARVVEKWHRKGGPHCALRCSSIYRDAEGGIILTGPVQESSKEADITAFGGVLYEIFSGQTGTGSQFPPEMEALHRAGINPKLVELVRRCNQPSKLPRNMAEIVRELENILRAMLGATQRRIPRRLVAAAFLVLIALAALAAWFFTGTLHFALTPHIFRILLPCVLPV